MRRPVVALFALMTARSGCDGCAPRPQRGAGLAVSVSVSEPSRAPAASGSARGPAPPVFTHARAYVFNRGRSPRPCGSILEDDGALCASAEKPGVALSDDQIWRALSAFAEPSPEAPTAPWCFDPHHGVVLYDAEERPVGGMSICFECDRKERWPKLAGREFDPPQIGARALGEFRRLFCDELGMKPCGEE